MKEKITPNLLTPKIKMSANELCWCMSGLKWKKCHKDRELQEPEHEGRIISLLNQGLDTGYCLHPEASDARCDKTINSHTIQKNGGLADITENGHIISPKKGVEQIFKNNGSTTPQKFGVKKATTFKGFCGFHDNEMFEQVEQKSLSINSEAAFKLSFRALCYEYLLKESAVKIYNQYKVLDKGLPYVKQVEVQKLLYIQSQGLEIGMEYIREWKSRYDSMYRSNNYSDFEFYFVEFDGIFPLVASGAFIPEFDCAGNRIQHLTEKTDLLDTLCFNITSFNGRSVLVLGWLPAKSNANSLFVESLMNVSDKANTAMYIAIEQLENIYFKPSWWETLPRIQVLEIEKRFGSGIASNRTGKAYSNLPFQLSRLTVVNEHSSI